MTPRTLAELFDMPPPVAWANGKTHTPPPVTVRKRHPRSRFIVLTRRPHPTTPRGQP